MEMKGEDLSSYRFENRTFAQVNLLDILIEQQLVFENCNFQDYIIFEKIEDGAILFKNCNFQKQIQFKCVNSKLTFIDCEFNSKMTLYDDIDIDIGIAIEFVHCEFKNLLNFNNFKDTKLTFENCIIRTLELDNQCEKIQLLIESSEIDVMKINNALINELVISNSIILKWAKIASTIIEQMSVTNSKVIELNFINVTRAEIVIRESYMQLLELTNCQINQLEINATQIVEALIINEAKVIKLKDSVINRIESDSDNMWGFLQKEKFEGPLFYEFEQRKNDAIYWKELENTLCVLMNSFTSDHQYRNADTSYYLMRKAEYQYKILSNMSFMKNLNAHSIYIFLGIISGWGVKIRNPIVTAVILTFLYAGLYFKEMGATKENIVPSFKISLERFFNTGEGIYVNSYLPFFEVQQSIIGVCLITLITGMFIRKLVR